MRTFRFAAIFTLITTAGIVAQTEWCATLANDMLQSRNLRDEMACDVELCANLEVKNQEIMRRIAIKDELVGELIAGRTTLAEVAETFLALNQDRPEIMQVLRSTHPGDTDYERSAHNVLCYLSAELSYHSFPRRMEVHARLASEYELLCGVVLPVSVPR